MVQIIVDLYIYIRVKKNREKNPNKENIMEIEVMDDIQPEEQISKEVAAAKAEDFYAELYREIEEEAQSKQKDGLWSSWMWFSVSAVVLFLIFLAAIFFSFRQYINSF